MTMDGDLTAGHSDPIRLVAECRLAPGSQSSRDKSFDVIEYLELRDGRMIQLNDDRGFSIGVRSSDGRSHDFRSSREEIESTVRNVLLPDDEFSTEARPWDWLARTAQSAACMVTAEDLRGLPSIVRLSPEVEQLLKSN